MMQHMWDNLLKKCVGACLLSFATLNPFLEAQDLSLKRNQFYIGPEWSDVKRERGETRQRGDVIGLRAGYDRLKRYKWYVGGDGFYGSGILKGHGFTADGERFDVKSRLTNYGAEGRLGYTLQQKDCYQIALTPFVGGGYFVERNNFSSPSPLPVHFKIHFPYVVTGFLSWIHLTENFEAGFNFKARYPLSPRCRVSNDPDEDPVNQRINERWQYRLELPLTYRVSCDGRFCLGVVPFYEYRHYGMHPNFPFDFFKTKLRIWGIGLQLLVRLY